MLHKSRISVCPASVAVGSRRQVLSASAVTHPRTYSYSLEQRAQHSYADVAASTTISLIEEETLPNYDAEQFYPVRIGDVLNVRYTVLGELGYGITSTVWLCRDLSTSEYAALKAYVRTLPDQPNREEIINNHFSGLTTSHPGCFNIRPVLDDFYLPDSNGFRNYCIVHPPLHTTMFEFQRLHGNARPLPEGLVKDSIQLLDFLHTEALVTHCDIKLSNLMLQIRDMKVLAAFEEAEKFCPTPRKVISESRVIYKSRKLAHPKKHAFGLPVLCDFGEARIGRSFEYGEIQPDIYKAPEVLLQLEWNQMVDIWNLACVAWDMIEARHLFDGDDEEGYHNNRVHIGEMVGLIGDPPPSLLRQSANSWRVFDDNGRLYNHLFGYDLFLNTGKWKGNPPLSPDSLEDRLTQLQGTSKTRFLAFIRSMLQWQPERRKSARELLDDPWLLATD